MARPAVLFAEEATTALKQGFDQMASLVALTLGPMQGNILNEHANGKTELLTDAATIARRIIEFPQQAANVGAMLMRNLIWRVHLQAGDGVATTAVLTQAILSQSFRYIQAGGNPMLLKRGLDQAAKVALAELSAQANLVTDEEGLTQVAETITAEPALSLVLGEMFDVLGPTAHITVEDYVAPYLERSYFDGGRWVARVQSPYFITDNAGRRAIQNDCQVVLFAGNLSSAADAQHILELLAKQKKRQLLLVAYEVSGDALSTLVLNHQRETVKSVVVGLRRPANRRAEDFADLSLITGATLIDQELGRTLTNFTPNDFGHVRRAEATPENLVISGGSGDIAAKRQFIEQLQARLAHLPETDDDRKELQLRLARLSGGVGVLKIGAQTKTEREVLHQKSEKAIRALRLALAGGVVPGGGVAFIKAIPALKKLADTLDGDEQVGVKILTQALEAPFRQIVQNRGVVEASTALAKIRRLGDDYAYDARTNSYVSYQEAGLFDPAGVLQIALQTAVSGAMMALTTGVIVLHRKPKESLNP